MSTAGVSRPSSSMCVRNICVYGRFPLEEKTIHRPFGEKLCQEFISDRLQRMSRASPPASGTIQRRPSGRRSWPFRHFTNTTQRPSGDTFGKVLLMPFPDAPAIGSDRPPRPSLNGILNRSYWIGVSFGSPAEGAGGRAPAKGTRGGGRGE